MVIKCFHVRVKAVESGPYNEILEELDKVAF